VCIQYRSRDARPDESRPPTTRREYSSGHHPGDSPHDERAICGAASAPRLERSAPQKHSEPLGYIGARFAGSPPDPSKRESARRPGFFENWPNSSGIHPKFIADSSAGGVLRAMRKLEKLRGGKRMIGLYGSLAHLASSWCARRERSCARTYRPCSARGHLSSCVSLASRKGEGVEIEL